jgi:glutamate racemase
MKNCSQFESSFFILATMKVHDPIGVFDSGVGGTSIWKEIVTLLPRESTIYLADSLYAPYGNKTQDEINKLCVKNTEKLLDLGAKIIVVACNTATTNAINYLRKSYAVPFIGIEPAIKPAALKSANKSIGILATKGTLNSTLFNTTSDKYTQDINVVEVIGEGLVPLIEKGNLNDPQLTVLLEEYLAPMLKAKIDYLVLGCSHYPYLIPLLQELLPNHITIIDSGEAVAKQTKNILSTKSLLSPTDEAPKHLLITNGDQKVLSNFIDSFRESGDINPSNLTIEKEKF